MPTCKNCGEELFFVTKEIVELFKEIVKYDEGWYHSNSNDNMMISKICIETSCTHPVPAAEEVKR